MARRDSPEINAGSMADIAFLLLIFFLVTTTMDVDSGIARKLPEKQEIVDPPIVKERNVFEVIINRNDDLLIEGDYREIDEIKQLAIDFIDNGGNIGNPIAAFGESDQGSECTWCQGKKDPLSSDHPNKAVISLKTDRSTTYGTFIEVQNELGAAYTFLRNRLAQEKFGRSFTEMVKEDKNKLNPSKKLKAQIKEIKLKYPEIITEANTSK